MVKETKKKKQVKMGGNTFNQNIESFKFVKDFRTWKENCQSISGDDLYVENVPTLYDFLFTHVFGNIRPGSANSDKEGQGAREALQVIEGIVDGSVFTQGEAMIINAMAEVLAELKDTSLDPKDILFTEFVETRGGKKRRKVELRGHYRSPAYEKKTGKKAAPAEWFAGKNPPHEALFAESSNRWAKPKGLLAIMQEAKEMVRDDLEISDLEIEEVRGGAPPRDFDEISAIGDYFDSVIKNPAFWSNGGKLLVKKVRQDLQARSFKLKNKDQELVASLARFNAEGDKKTPAGKIIDFKLTSTATPIIELVDRALKRAGTNKAPNGYRAWQNARKRGFDYRKTAKEAFPKTYDEPKGKGFRMKPDQKVISKMWQARLWRR
jgi:hypothetical protein|tara:strand:+ start:7021 stop:8157 length:1137 start_codon:yes stop_codon:yes gene_type:complete